jgi:hypothetical protein
VRVRFQRNADALVTGVTIEMGDQTFIAERVG